MRVTQTLYDALERLGASFRGASRQVSAGEQQVGAGLLHPGRF
ncbi:hypothetical protein ACFP81_01915 [Deinococcus lacus]|uniref:Uncharacterized protein n=1 Tax=Deinococcus lacus TaxID=392561 RepID=A0ABW1Y9U7_9DEIO